MERTLILCKPDCLQRNLLGEVIARFERKGLKVVGLKMMQLSDVLLDDHYKHHSDKPFFQGLKDFMKSSPVVALVLEGKFAVSAVRLIVGSTKGHEADAGTIRGDLAMTTQNIVHASDSPENAAEEVERFFKPDEIFEYRKLDSDIIYAD